MRPSAVVLTAVVFSLGISVQASASPAAAAQVGFSPSMGSASALDVVVAGINSAQRQILVAAYSFTSKPIAQALVEAKQRGVDVKVVADKKGNTGKYTAVTFLANKGVPVKLNGRYAIMHNKFMVIDGHDVETGSFNYTSAAVKKNAENALMLRNVPDLASLYSQDFAKLWGEADVLSPAY